MSMLILDCLDIVYNASVIRSWKILTEKTTLLVLIKKKPKNVHFDIKNTLEKMP